MYFKLKDAQGRWKCWTILRGFYYSPFPDDENIMKVFDNYTLFFVYRVGDGIFVFNEDGTPYTPTMGDSLGV